MSSVGVIGVAVPSVNHVLDGHVSLDLECLDRIYLNAYVPNLQVSGQVVTFLTEQRQCAPAAANRAHARA